MSHDPTRCGELFDQISSYLDGESTDRSCAALAAHLEGCEACRKYLESLRSTRDALRAVGSNPDVPAGSECEALLKECLRTVLERSKLAPEGKSGGA